MAVAGMLALSSCSNDDNDIQDVQNAPRQMTFTAGFGDGATTRASLSDHSVTFDANDEISILSKNNTNTKFTTTAGGASADFTGTANNDIEFYAVYPYTDGLTLNYLTGEISGVKIPYDQSAAASSACGWDPKAAIACATTTGESLAFYNVCALLKITNTCGYNDAKIYVSVNEDLAGTFDLDTTTGELTVQAGNYMVKAEGVSNNKTIYLAIAAGDYTDLFVQCNYDNVNHCRTKSKSSVTFEAGKIYDLGNTGSWNVMF